MAEEAREGRAAAEVEAVHLRRRPVQEARQEPVVREALLEQAAPGEATRSTLAGER